MPQARAARLRTSLVIAVVVLLPACAGLPGTAAPAPAPAMATATPTATATPASAAATATPASAAVPGTAAGATADADRAPDADGVPDVGVGDPSTPGTALPPGVVRPDWLGTRPLPLGPDGQAVAQPTPDELVVRRVPTTDLLPPPPPGAPYRATIQPLDDEVLARSTWTPECPVGREDLRHLVVSFWGFDDRAHTGEIIVHADWAEEVVEIFRQLHDARYPIEEMRIVAAAELDASPTGDGNNTTGFVCRPIRGSTRWSQHAHGLAIDVNPFANPYRRGERILPELAGAYLDRAHVRPGMLAEGSVAVQAFDAIGWGWGGRWTTLVDWMHFSADGR